MSKTGAVTIYHNPACGTSTKVLARLREAGLEPRVVEYLQTGWTPQQLRELFARMGVTPREVLRVRGAPAEELGLTSRAATDDGILLAMAEHPILVERPIVVTPKGARLCRPAERVDELL
ncbi:MAG TPA: arsenate reductase (glutaredoxin) [Caulobacteraceae bacterium]|jgi:arsenate reductase